MNDQVKRFQPKAAKFGVEMAELEKGDYVDFIDYAKLREENAALRQERNDLDKFFRFVIGASFDGCDTDGASAQNKALELGLLHEQKYDIGKHGHGPAEFYGIGQGETFLTYANKISNGKDGDL